MMDFSFKKQKIVCPVTGRVEGMEVLILNSKHEIFEMIDLDSVLLSQINHIKEIIFSGDYQIMELFGSYIYLNIEPSQLVNSSLVRCLCELALILKRSETGLAIEITERYEEHISKRNIIQSIKNLRAYGCKMGLDDFNERDDSRISIAGILDEIDFIKVEVMHINDRLNGILVKRNLELVVERVETINQKKQVERVIKGKFYLQGFLISKPMPFYSSLEKPLMLSKV
ncbi:EAL domain-containing protein [Vibrio mediterranei]|uniref:EAL domain-containing protein n=1 Tax=Vibrio mediterranei TaxID=689 RepID=A0AAN1FM35_9VIBR|nr:EAL domain-containing protein [Vibrio mediterranei]ASI93201.1 hypothetical protein BSZ05_26025 [Vibrio mediterranei]